VLHSYVIGLFLGRWVFILHQDHMIELFVCGARKMLNRSVSLLVICQMST